MMGKKALDARHGERGPRVDFQNLSVGHRRQHERRVEHVHGLGDVVGVLSLAGDLDLRGLVHRGLAHRGAALHLRVLRTGGERSVEPIGGGEVASVQTRSRHGVAH